MGKQYISTLNSANAHKSDILGLEICKKFTITISSDGFVKLWRNDIQELSSPKESVIEKFVTNKGLHHLAVFEDIIEAEIYLIIAVTGFDGVVYFYRIIEEQFIELKSLSSTCGSNNYAIAFLKNTVQGHRFVATEPTGIVKVYNLNVKDEENQISLKYYGKLDSKLQNFATSVALDSDGSTVAVGYQNGDVHLFELELLKPTYSFLGYGLKSSSTTVRDLKFSPVGKLLAVARDSGSYGTVTLYDVYYGETIGALTTASHSTNIGVGGHAHESWCFTVDFNEDGTLLVSGGFDKVMRVWNVETREREATISISRSDFLDEEVNADEEDELDESVVTAARFINKGLRSGTLGSDKNEGVCCVSFDKGVRWYREAGGI